MKLNLDNRGVLNIENETWRGVVYIQLCIYTFVVTHPHTSAYICICICMYTYKIENRYQIIQQQLKEYIIIFIYGDDA